MAFALDSLNLNGSSQKTLINPKFKQGAFENLPPEIAIDILSRLPIRTIANCKCVSKPWRHLIESGDFTSFHLSNSAPGLVLFGNPNLTQCKLFETCIDPFDGYKSSYNPVIELNLPLYGLICHLYGSANGLIFMCDPSKLTPDIYICNPVTREYVTLVCPQEDHSCYEYLLNVTYGLGVTGTGEHKLVRVTRGRLHKRMPEVEKRVCQVYTLGTGSWRSTEAEGDRLNLNGGNPGVFVNGNLHWLARSSIGSPLVSCFDLETEIFNTFSLPTIPLDHFGSYMHLIALGDCLDLWDSNDGIVIWLMKQYGDERSWAKEFVINIKPDSFLYDIGLLPKLWDEDFYADEFYVVEPDADAHYAPEPYASEPYSDALIWNQVFGHDIYPRKKHLAVYPIKIFEDGDILMSWRETFVLRYSSKTKGMRKMRMFKYDFYADYTPSLVSLKSLCFEGCHVGSF
ncbi:hypothetical protein DM860_010235 [Cuscuta australis]|uniref:F-box domain-containing protein n=1 Tax=Cuscuta australis TaxID=267555 RepID=A0A328DAV5_9ASTE|nr:hypothetical protein DM860_010235 [Cuscuta australis]